MIKNGENLHNIHNTNNEINCYVFVGTFLKWTLFYTLMTIHWNNNANAFSIRDAVEQRVVRRSSFGVNFHYDSTIYAQSDTYNHYIVIPLPIRFNRTKPQAQLRDRHRRNGTSVEEAMLAAITREDNHIRAILDDIYQLIPEYTIANKRKRTYCLIYCSGIAEQQQLDRTNDALKALQDDAKHNTQIIRDATMQLASYSKLTENKFDALRFIINEQEQEHHNRDLLLLNAVNAVAVLINSFIPMELNMISLRTAILLLAKGQITSDILPSDHASRVLADINEHLQQNSKNHYLIHNDTKSFYHQTGNFFYRNGPYLHVALEIRLSIFRAPLHVFRVDPIALPVTSTKGQTHQSQLEIQPALIAINDVDDYYLTFQTMPQIKDKHYYQLSSHQHSTASKSIPTCLYALLIDNMTAATQLCRTYLKPGTPQPNIRYVGDNLVLFQSISNYSVIDRDSNVTHFQTNCTHCLKTVPCGSIIRSQHHMINIPDCPQQFNNNDNSTTYFIHNLHIIGQLLDTEILDRISASFTTEIEQNFTIPPIDFRDPIRLKDAFKIMDINKHDLASILNHTLQNGLIFDSPADHVIHIMQNTEAFYTIPPDTFTINWQAIQDFFLSPLFSMAFKALNILEAAAIIYLYLKLNRIMGMVAALNGAPQAIAQSVTPNMQELIHKHLAAKMETTTQYTSTSSNFNYTPLIAREYHPLDFFILIVLIAILAYIAARFARNKKRQNALQLYIDLTSAEKQVIIKLMSMPHSAQFYKLSADKFIERIYVTPGLFPKLNIIWPSLTISHKILNMQRKIPKQYHINWYQSYQVQKVLKAPFQALLFIRDGNEQTYRLAPIVGTRWEEIQPENAGNQAQSPYENPPGYV